MNLIPNIPAKVFSFSAVAIGYLLIDDLTANEQNALGNWLMLVAQVLSTNAFYKQVEAERNGTTQSVPNDMSHTNKTTSTSEEETIIMMQKMINALTKEVNDLKAKYNV